MNLGLFGRGRLGSAIAHEIAAHSDLELMWKVGRETPPNHSVDVAIDASAAPAVEAHLDWALQHEISLVIGTTGWQIPDLVNRVENRIGVLVASNFSMTVALMVRLAKLLGRFAAQDEERDLYLLEHHHRHKADAPSGTAKTLATAMMEGCPRKTEWVMGTAKPHQLSVGVLRAGAEFGTHSIGLDGPAEILEITHTARSRVPFAQGAITAARWLQGHKGLFTMDQVAQDTLDPLFH